MAENIQETTSSQMTMKTKLNLKKNANCPAFMRQQQSFHNNNDPKKLNEMTSNQHLNENEMIARSTILLGPSKIIKKDSDGITKSILSSAVHTTNNSNNLQKLIENKLKRKKRISSSLISINGDDQQHTINEEKRTKVEINQNISQNTNTDIEQEPVITKPPIPPSKFNIIDKNLSNNKSVSSGPAVGAAAATAPPPRLKRKIEENSNIIQKLNAQTEQLRLEIVNLKNALNCEKYAVRALRAQSESENRKSKNEIKKLQTALEATKKLTSNYNQLKLKSNIKDDNTILISKENISTTESNKMNCEILSLKDAIRILDEKLRICNESERRKTLYVQELTESYETRLTQISKSAKTEISRLLEEIKSKERIIGQYKKEINSVKNLTNQKINKEHKSSQQTTTQHPTEMKKLKDIVETTPTTTDDNLNNCVTTTETTNIDNFNDNFKRTTTFNNNNQFNSSVQQYEINKRILEAQHPTIDIYRTKEDIIMNSDSDSALSSAPQSISPQPPTSTEQDPTHIWHTVKNYTKELENLKNENATLQSENETLKSELKFATEKIHEFEEKTTIEAKHTMKMKQLKDRIQHLEMKQNDMLKENHELHEQNELMEFRILELEESHDKWSLRGNSTSSADTKEMWTDTDLLLFTDRSDSGVTSPHSQNNIDDRNIISPSELSLLDPISNEEIKRRITLIAKKTNLDEDIKMCLHQVIHLINNLDNLSNDSMTNCCDDSLSYDMLKSKISSDYNSASSSPSRSILSTTTASISDKYNNKNSRIVATVLPYNSNNCTPPTASLIESSPTRKYRNNNNCSWISTSSSSSINLQESGVFDGDNLLLDSFNQSTQTEPEIFLLINHHNNSNNLSTKDLCAEIQKLNKFREQIEESTIINTNPVKTVVTQILTTPPNILLEQKRIQYYKERLELLEKKLIVYESSGDIQIKHLTERLQREIYLENLVKELREKVENLYQENIQLEESKCEFEEAENDTRLRLQRLEIELDIFSQRNNELQISRELIQNKYQDIKNIYKNLQNNLEISNKKIENLEFHQREYIEYIELIQYSIPAIILYNKIMMYMNNNQQQQPQQQQQYENSSNSDENNAENISNCDESTNGGNNTTTTSTDDDDNNNNNNNNNMVTPTYCMTCRENPILLLNNHTNNNMINYNHECHECKHTTMISNKIIDPHLENELHLLQNREKDLNMKILELNRAYQETMENADNIWAKIELDYKDKLQQSDQNEYCLKLKITQLEQCIQNDTQAAQERIQQLEEHEKELKYRLMKLNKEHRELTQEHITTVDEYQNYKCEYLKLKKFVDGPNREAMELEKCRVKNLQDELKCVNKVLLNKEDTHNDLMDTMKKEFELIKNELLQIEVTNSELREEVCTLEQQILQYHLQKTEDDDRLRLYSDELRTKDELIICFEKKLNSIEGGGSSGAGNNHNHNNRRNLHMNNDCWNHKYQQQQAPSLAQELTANSPKRIRIEEIKDLRTATKGLTDALAYFQESSTSTVTNDATAVEEVARDVKQLADSLLNNENDVKKVGRNVLQSLFQDLNMYPQESKSQHFYNEDNNYLSVIENIVNNTKNQEEYEYYKNTNTIIETNNTNINESEHENGPPAVISVRKLENNYDVLSTTEEIDEFMDVIDEFKNHYNYTEHNNFINKKLTKTKLDVFDIMPTTTIQLNTSNNEQTEIIIKDFDNQQEQEPKKKKEIINCSRLSSRVEVPRALSKINTSKMKLFEQKQSSENCQLELINNENQQIEIFTPDSELIPTKEYEDCSNKPNNAASKEGLGDNDISIDTSSLSVNQLISLNKINKLKNSLNVVPTLAKDLILKFFDTNASTSASSHQSQSQNNIKLCNSKVEQPSKFESNSTSYKQPSNKNYESLVTVNNNDNLKINQMITKQIMTNFFQKTPKERLEIERLTKLSTNNSTELNLIHKNGVSNITDEEIEQKITELIEPDKIIIKYMEKGNNNSSITQFNHSKSQVSELHNDDENYESTNINSGSHEQLNVNNNNNIEMVDCSSSTDELFKLNYLSTFKIVNTKFTTENFYTESVNENVKYENILHENVCCSDINNNPELIVNEQMDTVATAATTSAVAISHVDRLHEPERVHKPRDVGAQTEDRLFKNRSVTATSAVVATEDKPDKTIRSSSSHIFESLSSDTSTSLPTTTIPNPLSKTKTFYFEITSETDLFEITTKSSQNSEINLTFKSIDDASLKSASSASSAFTIPLDIIEAAEQGPQTERVTIIPIISDNRDINVVNKLNVNKTTTELDSTTIIMNYKYSENIEKFLYHIRHQNINKEMQFNTEKLLRNELQFNNEFRNALEMTLELGNILNQDINNNGEFEKHFQTHTDIMNRIECLQKIQVYFKGIEIPILKQIEKEVSNKLVQYHCNTKNSKYYCTVYYPIPRP